jgi:signal transduction histidine kinase
VQLLRDAEDAIDAYLDAQRDASRTAEEVSALLESAFQRLDMFIQHKVEQSRVAQRNAASLDQRADLIAISTAALVLALAGWMIWWLHARAFRPIFTLSQAMSRFGEGDKSARAEVTGPLELRETARHFNQMAERIAEQRESQMAFLAGVAHDMRDPLSAIKASLSLLDYRLQIESDLRPTFEVAYRQVTRLERMVGDFLETGKLEAGLLELQYEERDLRDLVREAVQSFQVTPSHHQLDLSLPEQSVPVRCDPVRIEQVVTNLLSNASKYSPQGGLITIVLRRELDDAVVAISDHGVGISNEDQARVFEPFRRVGLSKESIPGVGLGLFMVRQLVEAHAGRIELESNPGEGSTFSVHLPIIHSLSEHHRQRPRSEPERPSRATSAKSRG